MISTYSTYSVLALDLATTETELIIGDDHLNIIEAFHTDDAQQALNKLNEFKTSYPKSMVTTNTAIARQLYEYQIEQLVQTFPCLAETNKEA
ncbi:hypothetical protein F885_01793 [Acinetobacter higginsii]|uniref:hypothetical protein n=1 Tax=Acinetobacter higginsii TaxID=70347 RepID=UPI0002CDE854|nr:hypothetical protein [Acinetobacter higginsii]ENX60685.1 hypothetical protein F885_01793 [Acinetobacter higginsii]